MRQVPRERILRAAETKGPAKSAFQEMTEAELLDAGAAIGDLKTHAGWPYLMTALERLEASVHTAAVDDEPGQLLYHRGERDAIRTIRTVLNAIPEAALRLAEEKAGEDKDVEARFTHLMGAGDLS